MDSIENVIAEMRGYECGANHTESNENIAGWADRLAALASAEGQGAGIKLAPITEDDQRWLSDNPNTSDIVEWITNYANGAVLANTHPAPAQGVPDVRAAAHRFLNVLTAYNEATKVGAGWARPQSLSVGNPIAVEYREARAALDLLLSASPTATQHPGEGSKGVDWKLVREVGPPTDGLYVAVYEDGDNYPVALCAYGHYEFNDIHNEHPDADSEGVVRGFGWTETAEDASADSFIFQRKVVAYLPTNFDMRDEGMKALRAILATQPSVKGGGG